MKDNSDKKETLVFNINGKWQPVARVDKNISLTETMIYKEAITKKSDKVSAAIVGSKLKWIP